MDDLISRQDAIDTVKKMRECCDTEDINDYFDLLIEAFNVLPSAQPEQRWIPMHGYHSDPMPEERKVYLVTYETSGGKRYVRDLQTNYVGSTPPYIGWSKKVNGNVLAWMPMPEPYREEGKG